MGRRGQKLLWVAGWTGSFIWVVILSLLFLARHRVGAGVVGVALSVVAAGAVWYFAPWRHPATPYWKLMLLPYGLFFLAVAWVWWCDRWDVIWLLQGLAALGLLSNRKWAKSDVQPGVALDGDSA